MTGFTIRGRLALLSGFLLAVLIISNIYLADRIAANKQVLEDQKRIQESVEVAHAALRELGELKYWLADLEVSWQIESEEMAEQARTNLYSHLKVLSGLIPDEVPELKGHLEFYVATSMKAVDAHIDGNRVLGNSLTASTRSSVREIDRILLGIVYDLSGQARQARDSAIVDADHTLRITVLMVSMAVILAILLTYLVMRSIIPPLRQIVQVMDEVTGGNPYVQVPNCGRKDEIGAIARAVNNLKQNLIRIKGMKAATSAYDSRYR